MTEIRDGKHGLTRESVEDLEKAIAEMAALMQQASLLSTHLRPEELRQTYQCSKEDRLLLESMYNAAELERAGNTTLAMETLGEFLALELPPWHQEMAKEELERLQGSAGA